MKQAEFEQARAPASHFIFCRITCHAELPWNSGIKGVRNLLMSALVETYSGARLHERPRRFFWQGRRLEVRDVLASWQEPDHLIFKVKADDGAAYLLRYHRADDVWEVAKVCTA